MDEKLHVKMKKVFKKVVDKAKPTARDLSIGVTGGIITNKMQDAWNKNKDNEDKEITKMENEKTALEKLEEAAMEKEALALGAAVKGLTKGVTNGAKGLAGGVKNVAGKATGFGNKVIGTNVKNAEKTLSTQTKYFDNLNKNMKYPKGAGGEKMKANMNSAADKVLAGSQQKVTDAIGETSKARKQLGLGVAGTVGAGIGANAIKNNMANSNNEEEKTALEKLEAAAMEKEALYDNLKTSKKDREDAIEYTKDLYKNDKEKLDKLYIPFSKSYGENKGTLKERAQAVAPIVAGGLVSRNGQYRQIFGLPGGRAMTVAGRAALAGGAANVVAKSVMAGQKALVDTHKAATKNKTDNKEKTALEKLEAAAMEKEALYDNLKTNKQDRKDAIKYTKDLYENDKEKLDKLYEPYSKAYGENKGGLKERAKNIAPIVAGGLVSRNGQYRQILGLPGGRAMTVAGRAALAGGVANEVAKSVMAGQKALVDTHKAATKNKTDNKEKTAFDTLEDLVIEKEALYDNLKTSKQDRKDASNYVKDVAKNDKEKYYELNDTYREAYKKNRGGLKEIAKETVPVALGAGLAGKSFSNLKAGLNPKKSKKLAGLGAAVAGAGYVNTTAKNIMSQQKALVDAHKEAIKEKTAFEELEDLVLTKQAEDDTEEKVDETALNKAVEEVENGSGDQAKDNKKSNDDKEKCANPTNKCAEEDDEDKYHAFVPNYKEEDKKKEKDDNKSEKCASDDFAKPTFESDLIKTAQEMCTDTRTELGDKDPRSIDKKFDDLFKNINW